MHPEAYDFVRRRACPAVLEIGSRNINGGVRTLFPHAREYLGVDCAAGPGVDLVADGAALRLGRKFDVVVCCEVLEHTPDWREIIETAAVHLAGRGRFIGTCAGPGRKPHTCLGEELDITTAREHYANLDPKALRSELQKHFTIVAVLQVGEDLQWDAEHPRGNHDRNW